MSIELLLGDVTRIEVDAVVTAANTRLVGGSGVNGDVHAAAGPQLLRASAALAPCPPGSAVVTPAFGLRSARWVVHAVGPKDRDPQVLASAYRAALARADEVGARSVAFPALATGRYGFPPEQAAPVSVAALRRADTRVERIVLVARTSAALLLWQRALEEDA